ncbi:hypothetical protein CH296_26865 [Rhodococcus sp. 14-2496-1d]|nr:hypothetical protein CH296_26865 [Rhodococcus sp. 14-2496-1d]
MVRRYDRVGVVRASTGPLLVPGSGHRANLTERRSVLDFDDCYRATALLSSGECSACAACRPHPPTPIVEVTPAAADGLVLTQAVDAPNPLPRFDNSAVDGYAVYSPDIARADYGRPISLPVHRHIAAGNPTPMTLTPGTTDKIMTGARSRRAQPGSCPSKTSTGSAEPRTSSDLSCPVPTCG